MPLKHRVLNTGTLQTNTVFNELIPYFVGAGTVQAGPGNTVSVPSGVVAGDLLLVFSISGGAMVTPPGWTAVQTNTPGTLVWRKFAEASETAAPFITESTTSTVMLAYRNVLGVDNFAQFTGGLSPSVTTSKTNNVVIQAIGLASTPQTAVSDLATTSRVNFSSTSNFGGFCISDEVQSYSGPSQRRRATGGVASSFNTVLVLNTNPSPKLPVRFTSNNIQGQLDEVLSYQGSLNFNGTTGHLSILNNASLNMGTSNFTLEAWIYLRTTPNNPDANEGAIILNKDGQDSVSWPQYALLVNNSRQVCVSLSSVPTVTPTPTTFITGSTTLALNTWHHVAFTRVGTSGTLYVNGFSDGSTSSVPSTLNGATRSLLIGYETRNVFSTSYLFPGNISNLRIVKGAALYTANFAPPRTTLLPVTNTVLLLNTATSRPFFDSSGNNNIITVNGGVTSNTLTPLIVGPKLQLSSTRIIYSAGQFDEYSINAFAATGGNVTTSGAYTVHTFTANGTFQVTSGSKSVEYLVVAGGGGGARFSGGGGAGGLLTGSTTVSTGLYTVTVGAGGSGGSGAVDSTPTWGGTGANSAFGLITASGGGGGASRSSGFAGVAGNPGGSGGGASPADNSPQTGGAATPPGQGNKGGDKVTSTGWGGGGGGGAGAAGADSSLNVGGNGGIGVIWPSGGATYYAGGGGGSSYNFNTAGTGGLGGGGNGKSDNASAGDSGTPFTGGGGGGGAYPSGNGGAGGSGIVIIRYLT
jgi:hypothetical protein